MTSVEWLIDQLTSIPLAKDKDEFTNGDIADIVNQAKEMREKEIVNAFDEGKFEGRFNGEKTGEQYYNETYKK